MPFYHRLGAIPRKRHTQFRDSSGGLYHEELMGNESFMGAASLLYHLHPPTLMRELGPLEWLRAAGPAALIAALSLALYFVERVEGVRSLRPFFAVSFAFAFVLRAVVALDAASTEVAARLVNLQVTARIAAAP